MSGLFGSLNASVKALTAQSRALEITGKNLANVNNISYARQRVIFGDRGTIVTPDGAESLGIEALRVEQLRDSLLDGQVMREISLKTALEAEQGGYQRAQAGLGQNISSTTSTGATSTTGDNGIAAAIDDFFNAFGSLAASPTDVGERQSLLQKASILSDRFQLADQRLTQVQSDLGAQISTDVDDVNRLLATVADLNGQIGRIEVNASGSAVDLRDQRQARLEELAAKMSIEVADTGDGQVQVSARDASGAIVLLVDRTAVLGSVAFTGTQITAGSSATAIALGGGSIKGSLHARDGAVHDLLNSLDQLARQLVTSVNQAYNPNAASASTGNFFDPAGTTAATFSLAATVTAANLKASDGGPAGDNTVALAISRLAIQTFSTAAGDAIDGTVGGCFSNVVSRLGQALASTNSSSADQANIERLVRGQRDATSGVSLDEEMADLTKYQRAYQASARVFSIVDQLLDLVVNSLGRG
jgi:flagellar hook-associated protein 1 FlgK